MLMTFLLIVSSVAFVISTIVTGFRIWGFFTTTDAERWCAAYKGYEITHPITTSGVTMILSGSFILAYYLQ